MIETDWIETGWIGLDWIGLDSFGMKQIGLDWIETGWRSERCGHWSGAGVRQPGGAGCHQHCCCC